MTQLRIDIWSDVACPWCYIGKRRLESALAAFAKRDSVEVAWRAFELNPAAARESKDGSYTERLAKKYGTSLADAEGMIERVMQTAKVEGLVFDYTVIRPGNTFDAHRLIHWAGLQGLQDAVKERFFRGYFCEGAAIGRSDVLLRLAVEAGLPEQDVQSVLNSDAHSEEVRADEQEARALGISGVPFFVLAGRYGVSGAQLAEVLREALERASLDAIDRTHADTEGASCGVEGC
jgi:predicted DsbA family dithiol-disulfide isomerase